MLKKTLYKHTREFLERNLPENFFLFKKSNKKRTKYFSFKSAFIKLNLSKLKLDKISKKTSLLGEKKAYANLFANNAYKIESENKFLFNLHTIKSQFEKRQTRNSDFKNKLKEKKKLAILYGNLSNKAIKLALRKAQKQGGNININLLHILEKRLDIILYRALFFPTINTAKQWLRNNKISVNYCLTNIPSYMVSSGDVISVPESSRKYISNNMIKYFIHYKLIHNVNENVRTTSVAFEEIHKKTSVFPSASPQQKPPLNEPFTRFNEVVFNQANPRKAYARPGNTYVMPPREPEQKQETNISPYDLNKFKNNKNDFSLAVNTNNVYSQINNVKLTYECLTIINNLNITLNQTFPFVVHKKNLSGLVKNFLYFANLHKYNRSLNMTSIVSSFEYKPFKLKANFFMKNQDARLASLKRHSSVTRSRVGKNEVFSLAKEEKTLFLLKQSNKSKTQAKCKTEFFEKKTLTYWKKFPTLRDNSTANIKTNQEQTEKLVFNSIFLGEVGVGKAALSLAPQLSFALEKTKFLQSRFGSLAKEKTKFFSVPFQKPRSRQTDDFLKREITQDKYKLNLYKAFLHTKENDLNFSKMCRYNYMFYFKLGDLKYVSKYVYSYNFIVKKFLFARHYFKLKPRNIVSTLYFKVLWYQINFNNIFFLRQTVNLLKNRLIINDISWYANSLKKKRLIKKQFNTYIDYNYTDIFNWKCKIIQTKINHKIKNGVLNIINAIINAYKKNNNNFFRLPENKTDFTKLKSFRNENLIKFLGQINSHISATKHSDFLFFLKLKKFFSNKYPYQIPAESLPKMLHYHDDNSETFGKINIKPLNLEISYRTLTIIYLFPPQKLVFPCSLDVELLVKYDI